MAAIKETAPVTIVRPEFEFVEVTIVGDTPLITHNFSNKAKRQMLDSQQQKATAKKREPKIPLNDFMGSLHWLTPEPKPGVSDEDAERIWAEAVKSGARFGFPTNGIKAAAAITPKRTGQKIDGTDMKASFFIAGGTDASSFEMAEIVGPTPVMREDMVRLNGKSADIRYRAEFTEWEIPLVIKINKHGLLSIEQVINAINTAGFAVGIGEWRPGRGGQFGTFHVKEG